MSEVRIYTDKGNTTGCYEGITPLSGGRIRVDQFNKSGVRQATFIYSEAEARAHIEKMQLLLPAASWKDDFTGTALDPTKWAPEPTNTPPNGELQAFTPGTKNISVANSLLSITARKEAYGGKQYTSGKITTKGLFEFTYGKIEARMKIPAGQGLWTAFWGMGNDVWEVGWPACGEFDVVEVINGDETAVGSLHAPNYDKSIWKKFPGLHNDFHVYSLDWTPGQFTWAVDDSVYAYQSYSSPYDHPFYLILTLSVGGSWPGPPNSSTPFPSSLLVDWVKVTPHL